MPTDGVTDTSVRPAGSASATVVATAVSGPLLVTVTVNVTLPLSAGVALLTVFVTARLASGASTEADAVLLPETGSSVVAATVALLVTRVWPVTVATMANVSTPPFATVPTLQMPDA